jgi:hypothetical protein
MGKLRSATGMMLAFSSLIISADSCHFGTEIPFDFETQVLVYSDINANGIFDEGEEPIPNAIVTLVFFPSGRDIQRTDGDSQMIYPTDDTGNVILRGDTFRYYEVGALTPCGYHATKVMRQSFDKDMPFYQLGFVPDQPQTGSSSLEIHFWIDQDGDGTRDPGEEDMAGTDVELNTFWDGMYGSDITSGSVGYYFPLKTDDGGHVRLDLGNVCESFSLGRITVNGRIQKVETTYVSPNVKAVDYSTNTNKVIGYEFDIKTGETSIEWGVRLTDF